MFWEKVLRIRSRACVDIEMTTRVTGSFSLQVIIISRGTPLCGVSIYKPLEGGQEGNWFLPVFLFFAVFRYMRERNRIISHF